LIPPLVKGYHYDPEKARQLLALAGYAGRKRDAGDQIIDHPVYADFASFIARQLEDIGLHIQVEVVQKSLLLEETAQSEALFFRGSWIADYPDAENYLSVFYSPNPAHLTIPVIMTPASTGCMNRRSGRTTIRYATPLPADGPARDRCRTGRAALV
jgi:ABC-type transport system substrate-binding protein